MKNFVMRLMRKYRELIAYGIVGFCTLLINIIVFYILNLIFICGLFFSNISAWVMSFIFSFFANKLFVFRRNGWNGKQTTKEMFDFLWTRLSTMALDMFLMWLWIEKSGWDELVTKILVNVIVIVINYIVSKFFVFRR